MSKTTKAAPRPFTVDIRGECENCGAVITRTYDHVARECDAFVWYHAGTGAEECAS